MGVDSLWRAPRDENALENVGGITPEERAQSVPIGASQALDGGSAALDLVFTYSNQHVMGERTARLQNTFTKIDPS